MMTIDQAKQAILSMDIFHLVVTFNELNSPFDYPLSTIHEIDDEEHWEFLAKKLGAIGFRDALIKAEKESVFDRVDIKDASCFMYDETMKKFVYFSSKFDIIRYFGIDNIAEEYAIQHE